MSEYKQLPAFTEVTEEADFQPDALLTGWNNLKMFKMAFAAFKAMVKSWKPEDWVPIVLSANGQDIEVTGAGEHAAIFPIMEAVQLADIEAFILTAGEGSAVEYDCLINGITSIFTTKQTIDATENSSLTAAVPKVLNGTISLVVGDYLLFKITAKGSTVSGKDLIAIPKFIKP